MTTWLWATRCILCGYQTHYYKYIQVCKFLAIIHSVFGHPYGYTVIGVVNSETWKANHIDPIENAVREARKDLK